MQRIIYLLVMLLFCSAMPLMADRKSEQLLDKMSDAIDSFGSYMVSFDIEVGGPTMSGEYVVSGDIYHLTLAQQEIYGDSKSRITIDSGLKEVVMESVDASIPMVVANPARAFKGLTRDFDSQIVDVEGVESLCVALTPRNENDILDSALIEIDVVSKLPLSARYISGRDIIVIKILQIKESSQLLSSLDDLALPDGYDIIDVR